MLILLGKGRPMDSYVFRPMIIGLPEVKALNLFKSSGIFHGKELFLPITKFLDTAATAVSFITQLWELKLKDEIHSLQPQYHHI